MSGINFILGHGERLTAPIKAKPTFGKKVSAYQLEEVQQRLLPEIDSTLARINQLPVDACPLGYGVMRWMLHPQHISKSAFPSALMHELGFESLGSRTVSVKPQKWTKKAAVRETLTTELFVAGQRNSLKSFPACIRSVTPDSAIANNLLGLEHVYDYNSAERLHLIQDADERYLEVGLHLLAHEDSNRIKSLFVVFAEKKGFIANPELSFQAGNLWFVPLENRSGSLSNLATFSLIRTIRPVAKLRGLRPFLRDVEVKTACKLPALPPVSDEPKVAILDGGLPDTHPVKAWVGKYRRMDEMAPDDPSGLSHGMAVTSAFLFGPISSKEIASQPFSLVDHYRVLDSHVDQDDPYELYRTLGLIEEVLLSRQYQFINLSLGPELPIEDTEVHPWTAVIDNLLSDGRTLMSVAIGNNGERDKASGNARIQVPADAVNALSVGSADHTGSNWKRATYSAIGPGRSPGIIKPDLLAFGGGPEKYFHVLNEGLNPTIAPVQGTSFAAPYLLRNAVGIRAILGADISPLAIKALLIHSADAGRQHPEEVGRGKIPEDVMVCISCPEGVARVVYQGELNPGKYIRAAIPLPQQGITGMIQMKATFCYACMTDPQDAAAYTRAGLDIVFRPNANKTKGGKQANSRSFFPQHPYATEAELRSDHGKWETVLHGVADMRGSSLQSPSFDIHYNAREMGAGTARAQPIPYALIVTLEAKRHPDLYNDVLRSYAQILSPIQPKVSVPVGV